MRKPEGWSDSCPCGVCGIVVVTVWVCEYVEEVDLASSSVEDEPGTEGDKAVLASNKCVFGVVGSRCIYVAGI